MMRYKVPHRWTLVAFGALTAALLGWPAAGAAQSVTGDGTAVRATVFDLLGSSSTTTLASTGSLSDTTDAREASMLTGDVPSLLAAETLHATTIGWPDQVASEASVAALALSIAGNTVGADFVMGRVLASSVDEEFGTSNIDNLNVNGVAVAVTGEPNQTIMIPGGVLVINEQRASTDSIVVNALHLILDGVADVVIGSATAAIQ